MNYNNLCPGSKRRVYVRSIKWIHLLIYGRKPRFSWMRFIVGPCWSNGLYMCPCSSSASVGKQDRRARMHQLPTIGALRFHQLAHAASERGRLVFNCNKFDLNAYWKLRKTSKYLLIIRRNWRLSKLKLFRIVFNLLLIYVFQRDSMFTCRFHSNVANANALKACRSFCTWGWWMEISSKIKC